MEPTKKYSKVFLCFIGEHGKPESLDYVFDKLYENWNFVPVAELPEFTSLEEVDRWMAEVITYITTMGVPIYHAKFYSSKDRFEILQKYPQEKIKILAVTTEGAYEKNTIPEDAIVINPTGDRFSNLMQALSTAKKFLLIEENVGEDDPKPRLY